MLNTSSLVYKLFYANIIKVTNIIILEHDKSL